MKRTNTSINLPPTPVDTSLSDSHSASRKAGGRKSFAPYLPVDVRQRARALASDREHISGEAKLEMRAPSVYALDEERPHFFSLPDDVLRQIFPQLNQKAVGAMAASCRLGYFYADSLDPMRRLPGLLGDLKKLRVGNLSIDPDSFKAFLKAIAFGGDYDRALLTPLPPALRCAVTVAMQAWGESKLLKRNKAGMNTFIFDVLKQDYDPGLENGIKTILKWHLKLEGNCVCSVAKHWETFFENPSLSLEIRSRTFETLVDFLVLRKMKLFNPDSVLGIALDNSLTLDFHTIGMLSLIDPRCNFFFRKFDQKLAELKIADSKREMLCLLDFSIEKTGFLEFNDRTRQCECFLKMLDATETYSDEDAELILLKMVARLQNLRLADDGSQKLFDSVFSDFLASNQSLRKEFDGKVAASPVVLTALGIFVHSLVDRIARLQNANLVKSLLRKISIAMLQPFIFLPKFCEYMEKKIAGIT